MRLGGRFLFGSAGLGRRMPARRLPARMCAWCGSIVSRIEVLPVVERRISFGHATEGTGGCQNRYLPEPRTRDVYGRDTHTQIPIPTHAHFLETTILRNSVHLLSQTRKAFTSVGGPIPALSVSNVTKKPHIPLNSAGHLFHCPAFSCDLPALH